MSWGKEFYDDPYDTLELLEHCNPDRSPIIHTLLNISATLPIRSSSAERSFSSLK